MPTPASSASASSQATITDLVAGHNENETAITTATKKAGSALAIAQAIASPTAAGLAATGTTGGGGGEELPGGGDGGGGQIGCEAAGPTGHDSGGLLNAVRAGQIVCGTFHEFVALLNPAPDAETRQANLEELLRRAIWHLKQGGFTAGRQQNPSGVISKDKLTVVVDGVTRAYDVFTGVDPSAVVPYHMSEVAPPHLVDDEGIPDS